MVHADTRICLGEWVAQNFLGFWDANKLLNPSQEIRLSDNQQKKKKKDKKKKKEKKEKKKRNKRTRRRADFGVSVDYGVKIQENEKRDKYLDLESTKESHKHDGDTNYYWCTWNDPQRLGKGAWRVGNRRTSRDHLSNSFVKIGQNTEKSLGDLKTLAFTQNPVKDQKVTPVWKTRKE